MKQVINGEAIKVTRAALKLSEVVVAIRMPGNGDAWISVQLTPRDTLNLADEMRSHAYEAQKAQNRADLDKSILRRFLPPKSEN